MAEFIAYRIMQASRRSIEQGKAKYLAYFPTPTALYHDWQPEVDAILTLEGYGEVIATYDN